MAELSVIAGSAHGVLTAEIARGLGLTEHPVALERFPESAASQEGSRDGRAVQVILSPMRRTHCVLAGHHDRVSAKGCRLAKSQRG
jgi:hypothetical protein